MADRSFTAPPNAVSIRGRSADHSFALARAFFAAVAKDRPGFTVTVSVRRDGMSVATASTSPWCGARW
jgi:hypothetical protein